MSGTYCCTPPRPPTAGRNDGWEELSRAAPGPAWEAWVILRTRPTRPNPERQHKLKWAVKAREIKGKKLDQWQYEVTPPEAAERPPRVPVG